MRLRRVLLLATVLCCAGAVYAWFQTSEPPSPLSSYVPQGALLAIESADFAALLHHWSSSEEQKRWLASDNYAGFSRSRLFGRLSEARDQFATTAGLSPDAGFLQQVAGSQSIFAWYDIGKLEFLYITRMPSSERENLPLLKLRSRFEERKAGDAIFYVRTEGDPERTVAFAERGDYLLLATREDLIADALSLMQRPAERTLNNEPWYSSAKAAASANAGDLRMTLNLARIVPSPYFRSYWVQRNITEMKQYSAAVSDIYREKGRIREERVLLPGPIGSPGATEDLGPVLTYLPSGRGIYRAKAGPTAEEVVSELDDKLLARLPASYRDRRIAPTADLSTTQAGSTENLEQLIDEPVVTAQPRSTALRQLASHISELQPSAMLVFSSAVSVDQTPRIPFQPIHSAVVLASSKEWNESVLQQDLSAVLAQTISVGDQGFGWTQQRDAQRSWQELADFNGLAVAIAGKICIVASDRATLLKMLDGQSAGAHAPQVAQVIAGFRHSAERGPLLSISKLMDGPSHPAANSQEAAPAFLSGNLGSLSETFRDLDSETFTETSGANGATRQSVIYQWH